MSAIVRPHVAISQRVDVVPDRSEQRDALDQNLVELAWQIGLMPCLVPNALGAISGATDAWLAALKPRGFILSGGNDLGDYPERDSTETVLLEYAKTQRLPLLGICRGMQMLAVWLGRPCARSKGMCVPGINCAWSTLLGGGRRRLIAFTI